MSAVYMCDNCGNLFSVNEIGWRESKEEWNGDNATYSLFNNPHNHRCVVRHIGPCCAGGNSSLRPRVTLAELPSGAVTSDPKIAEIYQDDTP